MVDIFIELVTNTFNKNFPMKKIKIHKAHIVGLSEESKALIKERNRARKYGNDNYKQLRNKCSKMIKGG